MASLGWRETPIIAQPPTKRQIASLVQKKGAEVAGLRDERTADTRSAGFRPHRIRFAQDHAHRRQDGHVQNGIELVGDVILAVGKQRDAAIAQIQHRSGLLIEVGEDRIRFCS